MTLLSPLLKRDLQQQNGFEGLLNDNIDLHCTVSRPNESAFHVRTSFQRKSSPLQSGSAVNPVVS